MAIGMMKRTQAGLIVGFILMSMSHAQARDVITEQHNVAVAERALENAQAEYDADTEQVRVLKERVAQQQNLLAEAEKKAAVSREKVMQAKGEYDKQQKVLDQAWKSK